jgi:hypothetical protein
MLPHDSFLFLLKFNSHSNRYIVRDGADFDDVTDSQQERALLWEMVREQVQAGAESEFGDDDTGITWV